MDVVKAFHDLIHLLTYYTIDKEKFQRSVY